MIKTLKKVLMVFSFLLVIFVTAIMPKFIEETSAGEKVKVVVCHVPPDDPDNAHTIEITESALPDHLAHGDVEGMCCEESTCDDLEACVFGVCTPCLVLVGQCFGPCFETCGSIQECILICSDLCLDSVRNEFPDECGTI
ncbi:MAG: hypothetical protein WBD99_16595 [Thermodesulfobacteriota bacterium]